MTFSCPICDTRIANDNARECSVCHWKFKVIIGGLSQKDREEYDALVTKVRAEYLAKKGEFSEETALPLLVRDPFETQEEFERRLIHYPPVLAGDGELLKEGYDIGTGRFPVRFTAKKWFENHKEQFEYELVLNRDSARELYGKGARQGVFAQGNCTWNSLDITKKILADTPCMT